MNLWVKSNNVTQTITWPFNSRWVTSYRWSIVIMRLTCTVREILSLKLAFAHVKGQKFTAHAPCYVTCRQRVQNNCIFGVPEATLPIHYATLVGLRWPLRVVCRWASPLLSISIVIFQSSKMGLKFAVLGGFKGENMKDECWDPPRKSIPTETRHPCKECGDTPKNVFSRAWQEK